MDPDCVVTEEEEDGYHAESDLEEDTEQDCEREVATFTPAVYSVASTVARHLDRVDEVLLSVTEYSISHTLLLSLSLSYGDNFADT